MIADSCIPCRVPRVAIAVSESFTTKVRHPSRAARAVTSRLWAGSSSISINNRCSASAISSLTLSALRSPGLALGGKDRIKQGLSAPQCGDRGGESHAFSGRDSGDEFVKRPKGGGKDL